MSKWYNVDMRGTTLEQMKKAEDFKMFLYDVVDKFEVSGNFDFLHFEIWADDMEVNEINRWLNANA